MYSNTQLGRITALFDKHTTSWWWAQNWKGRVAARQVKKDKPMGVELNVRLQRLVIQYSKLGCCGSGKCKHTSHLTITQIIFSSKQEQQSTSVCYVHAKAWLVTHSEYSIRRTNAWSWSVDAEWRRNQYIDLKLSLLRNNSYGNDIGVSMNVCFGSVDQGVSWDGALPVCCSDSICLVSALCILILSRDQLLVVDYLWLETHCTRECCSGNNRGAYWTSSLKNDSNLVAGLASMQIPHCSDFRSHLNSAVWHELRNTQSCLQTRKTLDQLTDHQYSRKQRHDNDAPTWWQHFCYHYLAKMYDFLSARRRLACKNDYMLTDIALSLRCNNILRLQDICLMPHL